VLLLDVLYVAAFIVLSPWILVMIIFRPSFRAGVGARFRPALHAEPSRPTVWLHGSSAGEIDLLRALAGQVETLPGDYRIVISAFAVHDHLFPGRFLARCASLSPGDSTEAHRPG
jgi:3-deoxy-D-manno-octulosonic-acid transferase